MVTATRSQLTTRSTRQNPTMCEVTSKTLGETRECERRRSWCQCMSLHALKILRLHSVFVVSVFVVVLWLIPYAHTVAQVCALFVSSSSPCFMRTIEWLSLRPLHLLFIIFGFQHFLLLFSFLEVVDNSHAHCRWGVGSPGLQVLHRKAKLKERHKLSDEEPKLDNARRLRGIYFIDPEYKEFKETIKNAGKKLETLMAPLCLEKLWRTIRIVGMVHPIKIKTKLACILEASESTRLRMEDSLPIHHEDHIAGKGDNSPQHCNLVHKLIPMPQAMKIPAAKAAVDKEWEKLEKILAWAWRKSEVNHRWSMKQGRGAHKFILPPWWTSVIRRMPKWMQSAKNTKVDVYSLVIL